MGRRETSEQRKARHAVAMVQPGARDKLNQYSRDHNLRTGRARKANRKRAGCENVSEADLVKLLKLQGGRCAICPRTLVYPDRNTHVDHDHETGKIRGILCTNCNRGLGYFQDDPKTLTAAARYARNHK